MKKNVLMKFLMGWIFCLMMILPSLVYADVTINSAETSTVDLETLNPGGSSRNAYVTGSGSVVTSGGDALWASVNGWNMTVQSGGYVSGYYNGVYMGSGTVTNYGTIVTDNSSGYDAIYMGNTGETTGTVTNSGLISGLVDGINFYSGGYGGTTGTLGVVNTGDIYGGETGIYFHTVGNGTVNLNNYSGGAITGNNNNGIYIYSESGLDATINNAGTINSNSDYYEAIYIGGYGGASPYVGTANITNSGTIGSDGSGIGIEYLDSATVNNNTGGRIESDYYNGIYTYYVNDVTINNSGTIMTSNYSDDYSALYIGYGDTATVNNNAGGIIEADYAEGVYIEYVNTATINNYGTIQNDGDEADEAVYIYEAGTVTVNNYAGGLISSEDEDGDDGIYIGSADTATVNNYGKIYSGCETALHFSDVDTVTLNNYSGGLIQGDEEEAVEIYGAVTATVNNSGTIEGVDEAIYMSDVTTAAVTNDGNIASLDDNGIAIYSSDFVTVTNNAGATITGYYDGIYIDSATTATVTNSGTITGYGGYGGTSPEGYGITGYGGSGSGYGILIGGAETTNVTNSGTINAYDGYGYGGYGVSVIYGDTAKVTNSGAINVYGYSEYEVPPVGGYGYTPYSYGVAVGVDIEYMNAATVTNSGTITATGGTLYEISPKGGYTGGGYGYYDYGSSVGIGILNVTDTTVNNSGTITATGGMGYGGYGGYDWGVPGYDGWGADAYGIYIIPGYGGYSGVGTSVPETTVSVTNSGTITATGSDGYGGYGASGDYSYYGYYDRYNGGYGYYGAGGYGGDGIGGNGIGINVEAAASVEVTNTSSLTITGTGANGFGGAGGYSYYNYGGNGGNGYGGYGGGISMIYVEAANVTNSGTINAYGGNGYGGYGGDGYFGGSGGDGFGGDGVGVGIVYATEATVTNSGIITGYGGNAFGGDGGYGGYGGAGGDAYGGDGYGVYMYEVQTASVNNTGEIYGYGGTGVGGSAGYGYGGYGYDGYSSNGSGYGVFIDEAQTATITNSGTIKGDFAGIAMAYVTDHAEVTNQAGGVISGGLMGVGMMDIYGEETAVINNYGTIEGTGKLSAEMISFSGYDDDIDSGEIAIDDMYGSLYIGEMSGSAAISKFEMDYGIGAAVMYADTVKINNYEGGIISGGLLGVGIGYAGTADVYNAGTITSTGKGILNADMLSGEINYLNWDVSSFASGSFFSVDIDHLSGYANGLSANVDYGIGVGMINVDEANVHNYEGGKIEGGLIGVGIANLNVDIPAGVGYTPVGGTANVYNSGTITSQGTGIIDAAAIGGTIEVDCSEGHCSNGFNLQNVHAAADYGIGVGIFGMDTVNVYNYESGAITGGMMGIGIANMYLGSATTTGVGEVISGSEVNVYNEGSITSTGNASLTVSPSDESYAFSASGQFGIGVGIYGMDTANVYNYTAGTITGGLLGVGMAGITDEINVINHGTISAPGSGSISFSDATTSTSIDGSYGIGVGIYGNSLTGLLADIIPIAGGIMDSFEIYALDIYTIPEVTPVTAANVTNYGTISGGLFGVGIMDVASANVDNYGTISASGTLHAAYTDTEYPEDNFDMTLGIGFGIGMANAGNVTITNRTDATIEGSQMGIIVLGGNTTLTNYGTITGSGGTAVFLSNDNNTVTLGTGSAINGNILVGNAADAYLDALMAEMTGSIPAGLIVDAYDNNHIYLDGMGAINAGQLQGFNSLTKTGDGTWVLVGDQDFTAYNTTMPVAVNTGVLALESRTTTAGVTASSFTQAAGASLGYVVNASATPVAPVNAAGALTVTGDANFNNGTIVVIPLAGDYAATTTYESVLTVGGNIINPWTSVVSTSALLTPTMVENGTNIYDLVLERESFATGASGSNVGLGADLDQLYEDATGDLRTILDEIVLLPTLGEVQQALTETAGGTHTAFQLLSFNGIGRYLGVLNNHIGGGTGLADSMGRKSWFAENYPQGFQLAAAGGGNSMNDAAPLMLAMAGNIVGQSQLASGTNWGFWIDGYASVGNRRSDDIIAKYKQTLYGGMLGFDVRAADNLFIGISGGISTTDLTFDDMMDNGKMDSYHGSLYVVYDGKPWYAEGIFTYAYNKYELERYITMGPARADSDYKGNEYVGYAEVGYKIDAGGVTIRPLVAFQVDYLMQEDFTETGAGIYNLYVEKRHAGSYQGFLGVNVSGPVKMGASAVLTPELRLKWAHEFSNEEHLINARFAGDGSGSFTVGPDALSRDTAIVGAGLNLSFNKNVAAYVQYDAELNKDFINHTGLLGIRLSW